MPLAAIVGRSAGCSVETPVADIRGREPTGRSAQFFWRRAAPPAVAQHHWPRRRPQSGPAALAKAAPDGAGTASTIWFDAACAGTVPRG